MDMENKAANMQEKWVRWNPTGIPEGDYFVTSFLQDFEGTKITLEDDKNLVVKVFFDGLVPHIVSSDEGIRMRTWGTVQKNYNDRGFFVNWFLYRVENSQLINWAVEESCGFYESKELIHYCIATGLEVIDILTTFEPEIYISSVDSDLK